MAPGQAETDLWFGSCPALSDASLTDAALRNHYHELQIGATHLGWNAWAGGHDLSRAVAAHSAEMFDAVHFDPERRDGSNARTCRRLRACPRCGCVRRRSICRELTPTGVGAATALPRVALMQGGRFLADGSV